MGEATIIGALLAGAASFISPCVLPLLPGYLSLMSGYSLQELNDGTASTRKVVFNTALFVLGFTIVFVSLGAAATSFGRWLLVESSTFQKVAGVVIIAMGLFIAVSAVAPQILGPLMRERRFEAKPSRLGPFAAPVMGMAFAFGWTPCIGPFLTAAFALTYDSETVTQGMAVLFFYSMGLGIPFLASALLLTRAFNAFGWMKRHLTPITIGSGLLLSLFGVLMFTNQLTELSSWFTKVLTSIGLDGLAES